MRRGNNSNVLIPSCRVGKKPFVLTENIILYLHNSYMFQENCHGEPLNRIIVSSSGCCLFSLRRAVDDVWICPRRYVYSSKYCVMAWIHSVLIYSVTTFCISADSQLYGRTNQPASICLLLYVCREGSEKTYLISQQLHMK